MSDVIPRSHGKDVKLDSVTITGWHSPMKDELDKKEMSYIGDHTFFDFSTEIKYKFIPDKSERIVELNYFKGTEILLRNGSGIITDKGKSSSTPLTSSLKQISTEHPLPCPLQF